MMTVFLRTLLVLFSGWVAYELRQGFISGLVLESPSAYQGYLIFVILGVLTLSICGWIEGVYRPEFSQRNLAARVLVYLRGSLIAFVVLALMAFLASQHILSRTWLVLFVGLNIPLQMVFDAFLHSQSRKRKVLCLYTQDFSKRLAALESLKSHVVIQEGEDDAELAIKKVVRFEPDLVLLGRCDATQQLDLLQTVKDYGLGTQIIECDWLIQASANGRRLKRLEPWIMQILGIEDERAGYRRAKRLVDLVLTVGLLPVWGLLLVVIACTLKVIQGGPVMFTQIRTGELGRLFVIYKFRTMRVREEGSGKPEDRQDQRLTGCGWFLRRTSLDELPQLLNVLLGDMSLVGPRPEIAAIVASQYKGVSFRRILARPGLTGLWQVFGRKQPIHHHLKYDFYYLRHQGFWLDLWILCMTLPALILKRGAR